MRLRSRFAFTLIELLVVIALIAILAAILFPVFAQARDRARLGACLSNMRQIASALMMYTQDHDETFPYNRFNNCCGEKGRKTYVWKNAIAPYLRNIEILACPSNPASRGLPGNPITNAEGWEVEPGGRMPISYGMNSCAVTWVPAREKLAGPPLGMSQVTRPVETILIAEHSWGTPDVGVEFFLNCAAFAHPAGKVGNFIFFDGHAKSKKWMATLYPLPENNWELSPNPDPNNRRIKGPPGCGGNEGGQVVVPPGPGAKEFQTKECLAYQ
jgi:prepilin-type N-terminal cleavage/methylation domain-containing protein/prepilin-type processing-associated H-X9-DG protein